MPSDRDHRDPLYRYDQDSVASVPQRLQKLLALKQAIREGRYGETHKLDGLIRGIAEHLTDAPAEDTDPDLA